ncbi:hypothetical protein RRG08_003062 [Elysia crispata]|uniref:DDE-1 domain-containing protein n=2 Tax=Elysia crispata TaxID=231223 RepID=A0AAE1EBL6_9GAST|nr:hypothetical protein RRG08_003062 [Elysia crispata]
MPKVISSKGAKQVGQITNRERGELVTACCIVSATGVPLPPVFVFPRKKFQAHMMNNAPEGSKGVVSDSGWITSDRFLDVLQHFVAHTQPSESNPALLILDNHESHLSLPALEYSKEHHVHINARFILKLCKEVMANERPRRFTAEQARDFLSQLLEDQPSDNVTSSDSDWSGEEENDRSRSRSSSTGSHRSHPSPRSTSSGELEATADDSTVSSRSSPNVEQSTSAARPRGRPRRQNVAVPRQQQQEVDNWRQVTTADGGRGTSKRIRFVPTKQPGIQGDLNRDSSVLDCWSTLMTNEILEDLSTISTSTHRKMPRIYKRKTTRGASNDILEREYMTTNNTSVRSAARDFKIDRTTFQKRKLTLMLSSDMSIAG